ncbi:MAG: ribonuclease H-like domain-containing protein, partial [Terrimicrobiaceae bacterium]
MYLDVEGLPDREFYYLIGARVRHVEGATTHSFWADTVAEEGKIWREFFDLLAGIDRPVLIHYGCYESIFLKRMRERYGGALEGSAAANAIQSPLNLLSTIYARICFPTYSNGLKEIAAYLGYRWSDAFSSGLLSIAWRERWTLFGEPSDREKLIRYNVEDCDALELAAQTIIQLSQARSQIGSPSVNAAVEVERMKPERPLVFKRNSFFFPELSTINNAAYWDYQRERVYVRSNSLLRKALRKTGDTKRPRPNKTIQCARPKKCPHCRSEAIFRHENHQKAIYGLKFFNGGIKRWIVRYHFQRYICCRCRKTFSNQAHNWARSKFGPSILAYAIYQNIGLRIPQITVDQMMTRVLGLCVGNTTCGHFKSDASDAYSGTYEEILRNLQVGPLLHADETRISIRSGYGFVWVFT